MGDEDSLQRLVLFLSNVADLDDQDAIRLDADGFLDWVACRVELAGQGLLPDERIVVLGHFVFFLRQVLNVDDDAEPVFVLDRRESDQASFENFVEQWRLDVLGDLVPCQLQLAEVLQIWGEPLGLDLRFWL